MVRTLGFCIKVAVCSSPSSFTVPIMVGTLLNWPVTISLSGSCSKKGFLTYIKSDTGAQTTGKAIIPVAKAVDWDEVFYMIKLVHEIGMSWNLKMSEIFFFFLLLIFTKLRTVRCRFWPINCAKFLCKLKVQKHINTKLI